MSKPEALPRPPQVTMVGWMIVVGSVFVLFNVFEMLSGLRTLETREMVEDYLSTEPGDQLGWSIESGIAALRVTAMVTAVCAAATAVLGWHVLRRDPAARIGLTVVAVPLFVSGVVAGGFISSLVAAAIVLLWMQPARDWFNGIAQKPMPPLGRKDGAVNPFANPGSQAPGQDPDPTSGQAAEPPRVTVGSGAPTDPDGARPVDGFGDAPSWLPPGGESAPAQPTQPSQPSQPYGHVAGQPYGAPVAPSTVQPHPQQPHAGYLPPGQGQQAPTPQRRPRALIVAAVVTWVFAGFSLLSAIATSALLAFSPGQLEEEMDKVVADVEQSGGQQITTDMLMTTTIVMGVMMAVFCLVACVAAALMLGRRPPAAMILAITSSFSAFFCLAGGLLAASPLLLVPGLASAAVLLLLRRRDVRAWLSAD